MIMDSYKSDHLNFGSWSLGFTIRLVFYLLCCFSESSFCYSITTLCVLSSCLLPEFAAEQLCIVSTQQMRLLVMILACQTQPALFMCTDFGTERM